MTPNRRICSEHRRNIRSLAVCAGGWVVLRVVDGDDGLGGLTAVEMVKYTAKG